MTIKDYFKFLTIEELQFLHNEIEGFSHLVENEDFDSIEMEVNDLILAYLDDDYGSTKESAYVQNIYNKMVASSYDA